MLNRRRHVKPRGHGEGFSEKQWTKFVRKKETCASLVFSVQLHISACYIFIL